MIKVKDRGAKYSSIVGIGEMIKKLEKETGQEYLRLNRGINMVVNMELNEVARAIDYDDPMLQIYPPNSGFPALRKALNVDYFDGNSDDNNIFVVNGGMPGLDIIFKTLDVRKVYSSEFYWGAYKNIMKIVGVEKGVYSSYEAIYDNLDEYKGQALIICDPNNPIGNKYPDDKLLELIGTLNDNDTYVIVDSPYRKLFLTDTDFHKQLLQFENVIINESFSKRMGLSGQRIGFVHSIDKEFNRMLNIHLLFATNGINAFSQVLIERLLTTPEGKASAESFRKKTAEDVKKNIDYLIRNNLLADEFYGDGSVPMGIFVIVKSSFDTLLEKRIGSVSLAYFTENQEFIDKDYSRICVSVEHGKFVEFFDRMIKA
jgi:aspartate/methionine/tyrosine aminotransferase